MVKLSDELVESESDCERDLESEWDLESERGLESERCLESERDLEWGLERGLESARELVRVVKSGSRIGPGSTWSWLASKRVSVSAGIERDDVGDTGEGGCEVSPFNE